MRLDGNSNRPDPTAIDDYRRFNLWFNPFGQLDDGQLAEVAVLNHRRYAGWLAPGVAIQFVGRAGRGKSTHLRALWRSLDDASLVYIPRFGRQISIPQAKHVLIDEAQRMPRAMRHAVFSWGGPLVLGTHWSLKGSLRRHGYHQIHTINVGSNPSADKIRQVIHRRIGLATVRPTESLGVTEPEAQWLQHRFGNHLRGIDNYLYGRIEMLRRRRRSIGTPTAHAMMEGLAKIRWVRDAVL